VCSSDLPLSALTPAPVRIKTKSSELMEIISSC
jgi:hypothetical protein